jgi:hypothetical protein
MERRAFERRPQGRVDVDLCFGCRGIWFDSFESSALAPAAVIELFGVIHERGDAPARPLGDALRCPACRGGLALTHDIQRTTRITYYRCARGDGRFTTFYQFLREKSFVRELSPAEVSRLRERVAQVKCSSCGAPVDLARDAVCSHCRMPLAILDADAVKTTLAELAAAEAARHQVDPTAPMQAMLAGQRMQRRLAAVEHDGAWPGWQPGFAGDGIVDLVSTAIDFLMTD